MAAGPTAFFVPDGDAFAPTELTRGPWDPEAQHAGPPAALVGRAIDALPADGPRVIGRITFEIVRAVPIAPLRVEARVVRPGRSVELVEAWLATADGDVEVMRATAWRLREDAVELPEADSRSSGSTLRPAFAPPGPDEGSDGSFFATGHDVGYHTAMDYRFVTGEFLEPGPATVWMRMRQPLVAGEEPTPVQRVLVAADSGNGVSASLDWRRFLFINVDLSVHLNRLPDGEWVCLDAITLPERNGIGLADTALYDRRGPIGRAAQTLLVRPRAG
jgi:hypothetical protein